MKKYLKLITVIALLSSTMYSCVSPRLLEDEKKKRENCETVRDSLKTQNKDLIVANTELKSNNEAYKKQISGLVTDTTVIGTSLRKMKLQYDKINKLNDELLRKQKQRNLNNAAETRKLLAELQAAQEDLQMREDKLKEAELSLNAKKENIDKLTSELENKNKKLIELQNILNKKDSAVAALKNKVTDALVGFEGKGLKVHEKNGKIYVSLEEKLLFKSGKWTVDPKGQKAIEELGKVLAKNKDINVMIEGHTDDVPYKGSGQIKDNWDLSVKRSTEIVKILLNNKDIDPSRIIAAGRSSYVPIDPAKTKEARRKNRRTEIILTPKLNELFKMLENN